MFGKLHFGIEINKCLKIFETQKFLGLKMSDFFETSWKNFLKFLYPKLF